MQKMIYLILIISIFITSSISADDTFPVKLKYGENVLSIKIVNKTATLLKTLKAEIDGSKLPDGISISILTKSMDINPKAESSNGLQLKIVVQRNCNPVSCDIPLTLSDGSNNLWRYTLALDLEDSVIPDFELCQNYPNPFNGTTNIRYSLPANTKENVRLSIYNLLGQQIRLLVNEEQEAGTYNVTWDGKDDKGKPCSSGIYFYKIKTNTLQAVKKMLFLE
ncbi:MAG: T9SS type A sorting domain-containing protein [Ignavibacteria bacterium]|jgi:hypothetical protein